MPPVFVYRGVVVLLWALAIWHCWMARGLFVDGSSILVVMMKNGGYATFYEARRHVMTLTQWPVVAALDLGVTDTQVLARLFSAGLFFLPTAFYHAALFRARRDSVLISAVVCAIAVVFLPTSFFIVGEHNVVCAAVLFAALVLATGTRLTAGDGLLLVATAVLLVRSYETMIGYGPLLAALTVWRLSIGRWRGTASVLYGLAALLFLVSAVVGVRSLSGPHVEGHLAGTAADIVLFWRNLQFILPLSALVIVAVAALIAPDLLTSRHLYLWAGALLVLAALSPLLWLGDEAVRPYAKAHYQSRMVAGLVLAAIVVVVWLHALRPPWTPGALAALARPAAARCFLAFQVAMLLAALPADILLSELWRRSIVELQSTIARRSGPIPVEETAFARDPYLYMIEDWTLSSQSLLLRRKPGDGIVVPPRGFSNWQPFDAKKELPRNAEKYLWGD
jgi:hypothetical protein